MELANPTRPYAESNSLTALNPLLMYLLPITILVASFAVLFRPVTDVLSADFDLKNYFVEDMIKELR